MISDVYFPRVNGVSTSIQNFRRELEKLGHEVTLIAPEYGPGDGSDPSVLRVPSRSIPMDPEDRLMKRGEISALLPGLAARQFDIVHIQTPFVAHYAGVALSSHWRIPRVVTYHTHFEEYLHHYLRPVPRVLLRSLARRFNRSQCNDVHAVIVPSQAMHDLLRNYGINRPIEIIPTGVDEHFFTPGNGARFRLAHGIDPARPTLVHVGRMAHEKNIDFLLHAVALLRSNLPQVLLVLAGEGPAVPHLKKLIHELRLDDNVLFVGYLERDGQLLDCYAAGDAFVFSSRTEAQGLVLLEAMAQGTPVVSLAELGTRDILDAQRGALLSRPQTGEFAFQMQRVLQDRVLRTRLRDEARNHARTWSARKFAMRKAAFYRKTIENCQ